MHIQKDSNYIIVNILTDINECNNNSTCDHRCINTIGSFNCECNSGYQLNDDLMTCSGMWNTWYQYMYIHTYYINAHITYTCMYILVMFFHVHYDFTLEWPTIFFPIHNYPSHSFCVCQISLHCFIIKLYYNHILILWY